MKKIIAVLTVMVMIISSVSVYAEDSEDENINKRPPDETIARMQWENEQKQISFSEIAAMSDEELEALHLLPINPVISASGQGSRYMTTVMVNTLAVKQSTTYYCGPAATLMALFTAGCYNSISGNSSAAKQDTLANALGTTTSGTATASIPGVLNSYTGRTRAWTSAMWTSSSQYPSMAYWMRTNLVYGDLFISCVDTIELDYYCANYVHFIAGTGLEYDNNNLYNYSVMNVRLQDPHYNDCYYGQHWDTLQNLFNAMSEFYTNHNFVY